MKVLGIIPARFASTRFPGKPLVDIFGKTMIQRVYEQALKSDVLSDIIVATDNDEIFKEVQSFKGQVMMTSSSHRNGTERCAEVLSKSHKTYDIVINIQGDEPFFEPSILKQLITSFQDEDIQIATLIKRIDHLVDLENKTVVKAVISNQKKALYFSRLPIPFQANPDKPICVKENKYFKHIGIYAYRPNILKEIVLLKNSSLEKIESLEQLRWLENDYVIGTSETKHDSNSVDTPEDLKALLQQFDNNYFD